MTLRYGGKDVSLRQIKVNRLQEFRRGWIHIFRALTGRRYLEEELYRSDLDDLQWVLRNLKEKS